jgi:comEA protein
MVRGETMINLTKEEKTVLVFFIAFFLAGSVLSFSKKRCSPDPKSGTPDASRKNTQERRDRVNLNEAGIKELISLKGIGEKTAFNIIDYREENGPFFTSEDIMNVKGIGRAKFRKIADHITVE